MYHDVMVLMDKGQLGDALSLLVTQQPKPDTEAWLEKIFLQAEIYRLMGEYDDAYETIMQILVDSKDDMVTYSRQRNEMAYILWRQKLHKWDIPAFVELEPKMKGIMQLPEVYESKPNTEIIADYYHIMGLIHLSKGHYRKALGYNKESLSYRLAKDVKYVSTLMNIGICYEYVSELSLALEHLQQAEELLGETGNRIILAHIYNNLGVVYSYMGYFSKALEYNEKSLKIDLKVGMVHKIANVYQNIAAVYANQGKYQDAIQLHKKALDMRIEHGTEEDQGISYARLGEAYVLKGDLDAAKECFEKALDVRISANNQYYIANSLADLIKLHYLKPDLRFSEYFSELKQIADQTENEHIQLTYLLCDGLAYKENPSFEKMVHARDNFQTILKSSELDFNFHYTSMLHLTELNLIEYKLLKTEGSLAKLQQDLDSFDAFSKTHDSFIIKLEALSLRIGLHSVKGNFDTALELIQDGIDTCDAYGLLQHKKHFEKERIRILERLQSYRNIVKGSESYLQEEDEKNFDNYLEHVIQSSWSNVG